MRILEVTGKTIDEAINKALNQLNVSKEDIEIDILENPSKGFLGIIGNKEGKIRVKVKEKNTDIAKKFIQDIIDSMKIDAKVNVEEDNETIKIDVLGEDAGCLIGRRGETLDSIQFLAGLAVNKNKKNSHMRVLVDIENYRSKREESLIRYAKKTAREVAKTRKTKKLDYMNPYERRIIHSALQNDSYVNTYSEGIDPYRRLVIEYKGR
ncbi:MAG TPA: RNA-binding cell elongation regulator Jag/EloR [Peptostreptococcaceae bacterium]|nr:RNA-binding cell elongation regulator Jag/EloR [Peptostreptococcaceae bacterium]